MKLKEFALFSEVISALAIVISLIFVGLEVRQSNNLSRASTYQEILTNINDHEQSIRTNPDDFRVWSIALRGVGADIAALSEDDRLRLNMMTRSQIRHYETAFYAYNYDTLGLDEWDRMARLACASVNSIPPELWDEDISFALSEQFNNYLIENCRRN